eukprot:scaffold119682_cov72-Phaeocystis_antarctica.AAC.1
MSHAVSSSGALRGRACGKCSMASCHSWSREHAVTAIACDSRGPRTWLQRASSTPSVTLSMAAADLTAASHARTSSKQDGPLTPWPAVCASTSTATRDALSHCSAVARARTAAEATAGAGRTASRRRAVRAAAALVVAQSTHASAALAHSS